LSLETNASNFSFCYRQQKTTIINIGMTWKTKPHIIIIEKHIVKYKKPFQHSMFCQWQAQQQVISSLDTQNDPKITFNWNQCTLHHVWIAISLLFELNQATQAVTIVWIRLAQINTKNTVTSTITIDTVNSWYMQSSHYYFDTNTTN
jgi:hypothetical protein